MDYIDKKTLKVIRESIFLLAFVNLLLVHDSPFLNQTTELVLILSSFGIALFFFCLLQMNKGKAKPKENTNKKIGRNTAYIFIAMLIVAVAINFWEMKSF